MRKIKIASILILILIILVSCNNPTDDKSTENESSSRFTDIAIANIPQPERDEFSNYEDVINTFFEAINHDDFNAALECFPIVEHYHANSVDNYFEYLSLYRFQSEAPMIENKEHNFFSIYYTYLEMWNRYRMMALLFSHPELADFQVTKEDQDWESRLNEIKNMKITKQFSNIKITRIMDKKIQAIHEEMGIKEIKLLEVEFKIDNEVFSEGLISVGEIGGNWRILDINDPLNLFDVTDLYK